MANLPSSAKRERQTLRRTRINLFWKERIKSLAKKIRALDRGTKLEEDPDDFWRRVQKTVDKAAQKGVIHQNKAARLKSRWSKKLGNAWGQPEKEEFKN